MKINTQNTLFFTIFIIFCISIGFSHVLQLKQCHDYDAEFSQITYGRRLLGDIFTTLDSISLRGCLSKCLYHLGCLSVNYMRANQICEILGNTVQQNSSLYAVLASNESDWNHFETNYNRKAVRIFSHSFHFLLFYISLTPLKTFKHWWEKDSEIKFPLERHLNLEIPRWIFEL